MKRLILLSAALGLFACQSVPPPTPRALECNELCTDYITKDDLVHAEVQCDLGLQFSPMYADLWVNKGLIALKRGQDDKAKEFFIKGLRYNQEHASGYNNLGYVYYKHHEYGKAHDNFQRALRVNPDYLEARFNLALTFKEMKDIDKAKKEFRTIIEVNNQLADPHAKLGEMLFEEGSNEEASEELQKAVQLDPKYVDAWNMLGNVFMEMGKPCEAKDSFSSCIESDAENPQCRNNIIVAEKKCRLQDKAMQDVKDRQSGAKTADTEYAAAREYHDKGLMNDEERAYKRCLKFDPKYVRCHFGLYELFRSRGDDKNATTACRNFIKFANEGDKELEANLDTCKSYVRD